jgi:pimeloyl-ACP methyl ester carboxylesterase
MQIRSARALVVTAVLAVTTSVVGYGQQGGKANGPTKQTAKGVSTPRRNEVKQSANGKYAEVNGLKMYYEIHGSGKPLVLLHGAFGTVEGWATVLPTLAKTRQVIVVELQGHGHTADLDRPLTYEQMAEDTAQLLKQLKITKADIFGYSMGGTVALGVAIRYPELVGKLAILGSSTSSPKDVFEPENYKQYQSISTDFAPKVLKDPYDRAAPDPTRWPILVTKIKNLGRDFKGYSAAEVKSIKAQTLIMQGDRDGIRPEHAVEMYRLIPNAQLALFSGGDHFILFTAPDRVLSTLTPFLDGVTPEPPKFE